MCETDVPELHSTGEDRVSRCHRHGEAYADPTARRAESDETPRR
ncbi:hypothetical protein BN903_324 [Halorubrum sp. AJ67]|nr:hypothetical protein BN903_324 [Halorubrum sp. AJ67]